MGVGGIIAVGVVGGGCRNMVLQLLEKAVRNCVCNIIP